MPNFHVKKLLVKNFQEVFICTCTRTCICPLQTFMGQRLQYRQAMNVFMMDHALATTFIATFGPQFLVYEGEPCGIGITGYSGSNCYIVKHAPVCSIMGVILCSPAKIVFPQLLAQFHAWS